MVTESLPLIKKFYGASNSYKGFYSLFDDIFSPEKLRLIYILKGGPGCGKSTLLKKVSKAASDRGFAVENYYCSSSPTSLDGLIIPELSIALVDGTAPHTVEPKYPAVCERIIDLGKAWRIQDAEDIDIRIRKLNLLKANAYQRAYSYLSSCQNARIVKSNCQGSYILKDKLSYAVERICSRIKMSKNKRHPSITNVFTDCISGKGNFHLDTFENLSEIHYFVKDYADISRIFFNALKSGLIKRCSNMYIAADPLDPESITGIWLPEEKISFTTYNEGLCIDLDRKQIPYKIVNTARFCDTDKFRSNKIFYKYADKCEKNLMNGAIKNLSEASDIHDEIEKCYYGITDFDIVEDITANLIKNIF